MAIAPAIEREFPELNDAQRQVVDCTNGPLLAIAGPGSGKTQVLVVRALNILLLGLAQPRELLLCTFTEKAAFELRDRLSLAAGKAGYQGDLSELLTGTIHSVCNDFLTRYGHRTGLGSNYDVLDELTSALFLYEHFDDIIGPGEQGAFLGKWSTRWTAIAGALRYFDKITEELLDPAQLTAAANPFVRAIAAAYQRYEAKLQEKSRLDFAHQQKLFLELLDDERAGPAISDRIRYVMVDEYQDTNYVQEQLLLRLARKSGNICVVGDEDQALYRFRGGTVRNILEFPRRFTDCRVVTLATNYRSHPAIVQGYNAFMAAADWSNPAGGTPFRYAKTIQPNPLATFPAYPAVFQIWGTTKADEAKRFADLVCFLKTQGVIADESQVALLLHSVRGEHSEPYIAALAARDIRAFCPRARGYFENDEICLMVGCFALLLGYHGEGQGQLSGQALLDLKDYVDGCIVEVARRCIPSSALATSLRSLVAAIAALEDGQTLDRRLADYFYQFLGYEPFASLLKDENAARNLASFSNLLNVFQNYFHYSVVTARNRELLRYHFFNSFLRHLHAGGINEYEDPDQPFPKGHVQIMTIHQAKGLEFPVVVVGSLAAGISSAKEIDATLGAFYHRPPFEPAARITGFDRMRLHYVAFSRPEKLLVLTSTEQPKAWFRPIWDGLPQWPYVQQELLKALAFPLRQRSAPKKSFSFTSDLKVYETCPRQYQFFRQYDFVPARSAEIFFGSLVHQTIEAVHRIALDGQFDTLDEQGIRGLFDTAFRRLVNHGVRPIGAPQRERAFEQVMHYVSQNQAEIRRIIETEVDVSVEKPGYILVGKIDLVLGGDGRLELLDFKSQTKPAADDARLNSYYRQLCIYAHILEQRYGKRPDRLLLYWTGEARKQDALTVFPYDPNVVVEAGTEFDGVVERIQARDFLVRQPPEAKVCRECDLRRYCTRDHTIALPELEW